MARKGFVFGVGINDCVQRVHKITESRHIICPYYARWKEMLRRCYSENYHQKRPTYIGCLVCNEWLIFSNFKRWMETQDWKGKELDKDIISDGNKLYSPENCAFVDASVNNFTTDRKSFRGKHPLGVNLCGGKHPFRAQCRNPFTNKREILGYFDDPDEAHLAWRKRKHQLACQLADLQTDDRVAAALRIRYL